MWRVNGSIDNPGSGIICKTPRIELHRLVMVKAVGASSRCDPCEVGLEELVVALLDTADLRTWKKCYYRIIIVEGY